MLVFGRVLVLAPSTLIHVLEQQGCLDVDVVVIPKFQNVESLIATC